MKKYLTFALAAVITLAVAGCSSVPKIADKLETVKVGLDVVALDQEFEEALEALLFNEWTEAEQKQVEYHIGALQKLRTDLKNFATEFPQGEEAAMKAVLPPNLVRGFLNEVAVHFNAIRALYRTYAQREKITVDPTLGRYNDRAVAVWVSMQQYLDSGKGGIQVEQLEGFLRFVAKGYLTYKTNGLIRVNHNVIHYPTSAEMSMEWPDGDSKVHERGSRQESF